MPSANYFTMNFEIYLKMPIRDLEQQAWKAAASLEVIKQDALCINPPQISPCNLLYSVQGQVRH